jgi:hypothetical protein
MSTKTRAQTAGMSAARMPIGNVLMFARMSPDGSVRINSAALQSRSVRSRPGGATMLA